MTEHVYRRGAVYYWRRRLPAALRTACDPGEIQVSLGTRCPRTAAVRAALLGAVFAHVAVPEEASQGLGIRSGAAERMARLLAALEPPGPAPSAPFPKILARLLRTAVGTSTDLVQALLPAPPPAAAPQEGARTAPRPQAENLRPDLPLADLITACTETKAQTEWTGKTVRDAERAVILFRELVGARTVRNLTPIDASDYQRRLGRLPAWHGRSIYKGLTGAEATALADRLEALLRQAAAGDQAAAAERDRVTAASQMAPEELVERLHAKTINKHVGSLRAIFTFGEDHHFRSAATNPFAGLFFAKAKLTKNQRRRREIWRDEDLARLFCSPLYRGHGATRHEPGPTITRDALYWAPLLAALDGLRLEEALQLPVDAVVAVKGMWCLRIEASATHTLKSEAAQRTVPLHPLLVELDFPEYVVSIGASGHRRAFPELRPGGPDGTLGYQFTKDFGRYRKRIGLSDAGRDFHSFRKTFNSSLQRKGRSDAGRHYLLGHAHGGVNYDHYFGGFEPEDLLVYLDDVHYAETIRSALMGRR